MLHRIRKPRMLPLGTQPADEDDDLDEDELDEEDDDLDDELDDEDEETWQVRLT